jgi:GntR family transcriptional regulator / MocR family aminotransferase
MRAATVFELTFPSRSVPIKAYRWLYDSLRSEILKGRLRPGTRLPSTRDLSRQFGLARGTIVNAFEQLKSEGYIEGRVGSGTYVTHILPEGLLHVGGKKAAKTPAKRRRVAVSCYAQRARLFEGYENRPTRAFRANLPALDLFPVALWAKITAGCLRRISTRELMGSGPLGYLPLRRVVADYLSRSRGVTCSPEQVAIVSGVQQAVDLTARLMVNPGDRVCVESPGYPGAALVFRSMRAEIHVARVDQQGLKVEELPPGPVRIAYVTPGHQFPLGSTMSLARRLQLLEWMQKSGAILFEDDYDSEYRFSGQPIPALQGLDRSGSVIYAGSFSKILFPGLRLGYVVIPSGLIEEFEAVLSLTSRHAPMLEQLVLTDFIDEGHFARHVRRMRQVYAGRLAVLLEEARARLAGLLEISNVQAGLQTVGWLRNGMDADSAAMAAAKREVEVTPLRRYGPAAAPEGLQLGFAAVDAREIRRGVRELAMALEANG